MDEIGIEADLPLPPDLLEEFVGRHEIVIAGRKPKTRPDPFGRQHRGLHPVEIGEEFLQVFGRGPALVVMVLPIDLVHRLAGQPLQDVLLGDQSKGRERAPFGETVHQPQAEGMKGPHLGQRTAEGGEIFRHRLGEGVTCRFIEHQDQQLTGGQPLTQQMADPGDHGRGLAGAGHRADPGMTARMADDALLFLGELQLTSSSAA